mgnify:CR=1 FL=1
MTGLIQSMYKLTILFFLSTFINKLPVCYNHEWVCAVYGYSESSFVLSSFCLMIDHISQFPATVGYRVRHLMCFPLKSYDLGADYTTRLGETVHGTMI